MPGSATFVASASCRGVHLNGRTMFYLWIDGGLASDGMDQPVLEMAVRECWQVPSHLSGADQYCVDRLPMIKTSASIDDSCEGTLMKEPASL